MTDHVYRVTELAGTSEVSHADAIDRVVAQAAKALRHLAWIEVKEQRGEVENGKIKQYQVILKIGFRLED